MSTFGEGQPPSRTKRIRDEPSNELKQGKKITTVRGQFEQSWDEIFQNVQTAHVLFESILEGFKKLAGSGTLLRTMKVLESMLTKLWNIFTTERAIIIDILDSTHEVSTELVATGELEDFRWQPLLDRINRLKGLLLTSEPLPPCSLNCSNSWTDFSGVLRPLEEPKRYRTSQVFPSYVEMSGLSSDRPAVLQTRKVKYSPTDLDIIRMRFQNIERVSPQNRWTVIEFSKEIVVVDEILREIPNFLPYFKTIEERLQAIFIYLKQRYEKTAEEARPLIEEATLLYYQLMPYGEEIRSGGVVPDFLSPMMMKFTEINQDIYSLNKK